MAAAWTAEEALLSFYAMPDPATAAAYLAALGVDLRKKHRHPELQRLGRA
ncbi:MAG: hypothetical protein ACOYEV_12150 [Candidatus Nanopelagicales bacterium]